MRHMTSKCSAPGSVSSHPSPLTPGIVFAFNSEALKAFLLAESKRAANEF
jgi:hypothetical protein